MDTIFEYITPEKYPTAIEMIASDPKLLDARTESGTPPLHYAIEFGYDDLAMAILDMEPDLEVEGIDGYTPLNYAVSYRKIDILDRLIELGADVDHVDAQGTAPISWAFFRYNGDPATLRRLMAANADPTILNNHGNGLENFMLMPKNQDIVEEVRAYIDTFTPGG